MINIGLKVMVIGELKIENKVGTLLTLLIEHKLNQGQYIEGSTAKCRTCNIQEKYNQIKHIIEQVNN